MPRDLRLMHERLPALPRPPRSQISQAASMLANEYGTASNIKSRVNRLSVLAAITSTQQRLKLYNRVPPNGLVVYCGTVLTVGRCPQKAQPHNMKADAHAFLLYTTGRRKRKEAQYRF